MENIKNMQTSYFLGGYLLIYSIALIFQSQFWGDILSPIGGIVCFGLIYYRYFKSDTAYEKTWLLLGFAGLSWGCADSLWMYYDFFTLINPENVDLVSFFYAGTNFFIFAAVVIHISQYMKKWNMLLFIIDSLAISLSILYFLWIVFFDRSIELLRYFNKIGWIYGVSFCTDILVFICLAIWYFSIISRKITMPLKIISYSILIFIIADFSWLYLEFKDIYIPNSIVDGLYMIGIIGFALAMETKVRSKKNLYMPDMECSNLGSSKRSLLLLIPPIIVVLIKGFDTIEMIYFAGIIIIHAALGTQVQSAIKEHDINLELEKRIEERTREVVEKNKQLEFLANRDSVTNLYNRRSIMDELDKMIENAPIGENVALIYLDVDRFKIINDTYGHNVGDRVLIELSNRLLSVKNKNTAIARIGGDEFVFVVKTTKELKEIEEMAMMIIIGCSEPIIVDNYSFSLSMSIGISMFPFDAENSASLLKNADMAMYFAKQNGINKIMCFNKELSDKIHRRNEIEILLKKADYDAEFMVYYQPQFSISDKKLVGMEALLRWKHPEKGFIPPAEFIPIAEDIDKIISIGSWVLGRALQQIAKWNNTYGFELKMAVNVSPKQLDQETFILELENMVRNNSVKKSWVDIEITESAAMEGRYIMSDIANRIKEAGFSISIDDFGTGYSSLGALKTFPFDKIKIARELINKLTTDSYDMNITKFTVQLAKSIGIQTIAEGVEYQEQLDLLSELGCEQVQGYLLGKPVNSEDFEELFLKKQYYAEQRN
ncbi:MAG: putative bifunctional diguanylate cyclase/phosphodiesterase [Solirubrobacterales bacterium]